ncbi:MAG: hypothetical protein P4N24_13105 [Acidobacteriota bacterium]|nr:hypothetical protein [Acidobacteriota bacterium]
MSLVKPRVMTPARWAANRRNALKSTGPRTARGKAASKLNGLRHGHCSPIYRQFWLALLEAPPGPPVATTIRTLLMREETGNPVFAELIDVRYGMELEDQAYAQRLRRLSRRALRDPERSLEAVENNGSSQSQEIVKLTTY